MKVGDYCRTKDGFIAKLIEKDTWYKFDSVILEEEYPYNYLSREHANELIIKSSPNITDLIEPGDYVNGKKVITIWEEPFGEFAGQIFIMLDGEETVPTIREIKSIVTKEMFASMEYRIGE